MRNNKKSKKSKKRREEKIWRRRRIPGHIRVHTPLLDDLYVITIEYQLQLVEPETTVNFFSQRRRKLLTGPAVFPTLAIASGAL